MASLTCPEDGKKKSQLVCKHKNYVDGNYVPCEHYKGAGCAHPRRYKEEKK